MFKSSIAVGPFRAFGYSVDDEVEFFVNYVCR